MKFSNILQVLAVVCFGVAVYGLTWLPDPVAVVFSGLYLGLSIAAAVQSFRVKW